MKFGALEKMQLQGITVPESLLLLISPGSLVLLEECTVA